MEVNRHGRTAPPELPDVLRWTAHPFIGEPLQLRLQGDGGEPLARIEVIGIGEDPGGEIPAARLEFGPDREIEIKEIEPGNETEADKKDK